METPLVDPGGPRWRRRATAATLTLLVVLLPPLLAGAGIDAPPHSAELERLARAVAMAPGEDGHGTPLHLFYTAGLPEDAATRPTAELVSAARLTVVLCLLAISGLLYLTLVLTRRRTTAVLACLAFAGLPAVYGDGVVLRPEVPAAMFGGLGMLLVAGFPLLLRHRRGGRWLSILACALVTGFAFGLAIACLPRAGIYLLVPGFALLLVFGSLVIGVPGVVRRTGLDRFPVRGIQARWAPWLLLTVGNVIGAALVLGVADGGDLAVAAASGGAGLLPESPWAAGAIVVLAVAGAVRMVLGAGLRAGRGHRVQAPALMLVYAAALLIQQFAGEVDDALLAAPALALLMAEGVAAVALIGLSAVAVRRARNGD